MVGWLVGWLVGWFGLVCLMLACLLASFLACFPLCAFGFPVCCLVFLSHFASSGKNMVSAQKRYQNATNTFRHWDILRAKK